MRKFILLLRAIFGLHNVEDGTTCEISRVLWDVHDYPVNRGGDGTPSHFHTYQCPRCKEYFSI